jgi:hypothetical protein
MGLIWFAASPYFSWRAKCSLVPCVSGTPTSGHTGGRPPNFARGLPAKICRTFSCRHTSGSQAGRPISAEGNVDDTISPGGGLPSGVCGVSVSFGVAGRATTHGQAVRCDCSALQHGRRALPHLRLQGPSFLHTRALGAIGIYCGVVLRGGTNYCSSRSTFYRTARARLNLSANSFFRNHRP